MIMVDTSSPMAIFLQETDASTHAERIEHDDQPLMSAASVLEASIVIRNAKTLSIAHAEAWLDEMILVFDIKIEAVTVEQMRIARIAHMTFGKGTGHPAQLTFGDCFAHALAKASSAPLPFKGDDFGRTDIERTL
ncbi:MAG: type II toxin-antitoxin system VapC family toxin [Rhizobiaceae bacterium]|nr:type II toxin-antitoxin system VapC family toxin [Rhizobiaceae bacterium]